MSEHETYRIVTLIKTCNAVPAQWEGRTDTGADAYLRYRGGHFSVRIGPNILAVDATPQAWDDALVYEAELGGMFDGSMDDDELRAALPPWITIDLTPERE